MSARRAAEGAAAEVGPTALAVLARITERNEELESRIEKLESDVRNAQRGFFTTMIQTFAIFVTLFGSLLLAGNAAVRLSADAAPAAAAVRMLAVLGPVALLGAFLVLVSRAIVPRAGRGAPAVGNH